MNEINPEYEDSYSTIFQCTQGAFTCFLRFLEGLFSLILLIFLLRGYKHMTSESTNQISNEDKRIYILVISQTILVAFYYFLFEEFFVLATIRNLLIWVSINLLELICKIYWIHDNKTINNLKYLFTSLAVLNFLLWFVIAVSHGSEVLNTSFNLGYNCHLMDWVILSGLFLIVSGVIGVVGFLKIDQLNFQIEKQSEKDKQLGKDENFVNKNKESLQSQKFDILILGVCCICSALIMFIWDFCAYMMADSDQMCVQIFSGNTVFRKILCFLLKICSMQAIPIVIYLNFYEKRKTQFLSSQIQANSLQNNNVDFLRDSEASDLNQSLISRIDSRKSLFSSDNFHDL